MSTCSPTSTKPLASGEHRGEFTRRFRAAGPWLGGLTGLRGGLTRIPGQQYVQVLNGMLGDAPQNVGEPGLRINIVHFGRDDQAVHHGGPLAATIGSAEQPRLSTNAMPR